MKIKGKKVDILIVFLGFLTAVNILFVYLLYSEGKGLLEAKGKLNSASNSNVDIGAVMAKTKILGGVFPKEQGTIEFIRSIEQKQGQFEILSLSFESDEPQAGKGTNFLPFTLEISGDKEKVLPFISTLLNSSYVIEIDSYDLSSEDDFSKNVKAVILGKIYVAVNY